jgi:hypothetical protein
MAMEMKSKKIAAITAAVNLYMEAEQEALMAQKRLALPPSSAYSPWVMAGRAATMELRRSWQMRLAR